MFLDPGDLTPFHLCPECFIGLGLMTSVIAGEKLVVTLLRCQKCGHEWTVQHVAPSRTFRR